MGKILRTKTLAYLNQDFAKSILHILKVSIEIVDNSRAGKLRAKGDFIVSNHLSYIDGFVLGSVFNVIYVSKKQVKSWPFFGVIASLGATVFIDRTRKDLAPQYVDNIGALLKQGINILVFPEGTSTNGKKILPFQSLFFSSPIQDKADIIPVTVTYTHLNGKPIEEQDKDKLYWYGQISFHKHLWGVLSLKSVGVRLIIRDKIKTLDYQNTALSRHSLAMHCHDVISGQLLKTNA